MDLPQIDMSDVLALLGDASITIARHKKRILALEAEVVALKKAEQKGGGNEPMSDPQ